MDSSSYTKTPVSRLVHPHGRHGAAIAAPELNAAAVARSGAMRAISSTANDYAKFLIHVMWPDQHRAAMLSPAIAIEMLRPQIFVEKGRGGDNGGFHCLSQMSVSKKCGFVIFTNGDGGMQLLQQLAPHVAKVLEV